MNDLDLAKALAGDDDKPYAFVVYGEALTDTGTILQDGEVVEGYANFLTVAIDNYASSVDMYCETAVKAGDRLRIVLDPSGRYLVYAASEQIKELQEAIENLKNEGGSGEDTKVTQTSTSSTATAYNNNYPILFKYATGSSTVTDVSRIASTITANPFGSGTITAGTFAGNASTASKWYSQRQIICTDDSVVLGSSDWFSGAGGEGSQGNGCPYIYLSFNPNITGDGISVSETSISLSADFDAKSFGPTSSLTLSNGGQFTVPYISRDKYGRVIDSSKEVKFTLPTITNTDTTYSGDNTTISISTNNQISCIAAPKLTIGDKGDYRTPVYFSDGVPKACDEAFVVDEALNSYSAYGYKPQLNTSFNDTQVKYSFVERIGPFDDFAASHLGATSSGYLVRLSKNNSELGFGLCSASDAAFVGICAYTSDGSSIAGVLEYYHTDVGSEKGDTIHSWKDWNFHSHTLTYSVLDGINVLREDSEAQTLSAKEDADVAYTPGTSAKLKLVAPLKIEDGAITEWADVELTFRDGVLTDLKYPENYMQEV